MAIIRMPGRSYSGPLPPLTAEETEVLKNIEKHVRVLAEEIGERNVWNHKALQTAARHIESVLSDLDYAVATQEWLAEGKTVRNVEVELRGASQPAEIVIVGAHYDSVAGSPGANDNATGVAAMLEVARLLRNERLSRTVRFVAFANEEPPFSFSEDMGSRHYARRSRERGERIVAMLSLETIGYYTDKKGSQQYPPPFSLFYPSTGNFITFVGNTSSRRLVRQCVGSFREHTQFPSEGAALPGWITGIGWSDHWSFWQEGYPALMVTDTAPFRYPEYHGAGDTPDKIDYDRTARVVAGLARVVVGLAARADE